jgi:ABC-type multidrug transport system fused ATPase/permease subunit
MTSIRKLWYLLNAHQRRSAMVMLGLMLVGMVFETAGIGLVIPAVALMTEADLAGRYPAAIPILKMLGNPSQERLVIGGMVTLVVFYAIRTVFLAFLAWRQSRFVYGLQADLSQRLFAGYLRQPYTFHLERNSAQLIRNTINQVSTITSVLQQGLLLLTELTVLFGIAVMLLAVEPFGATLVMGTLAVAAWGFNRLTKRHILRWGVALQWHEGLRIQYLQEGLGGAKDVKLLGREQEFLVQYDMHNSGAARYFERQSALQALPRLWLEFLAIVGLAALVLTMIVQGKPLQMLLPTLGLFAAAAFRLMPSVNRLLGALQTVKFSGPAIDSLYGEFVLVKQGAAEQRSHALTFEHELALDQVEFCYPGASAPALRGISLKVERGASIGFIGGSGAGKSTLVDVILGLLTPDSGSVKVDGMEIQERMRGWQNLIGYVPQSIYLTDDTLRRNVAFGLANEQIDDEAVWRAIRAAQLDQFVASLPLGLQTVVGERGVRLSGGQRQRIGIARALYHNPSVLVLDEATSSLDMETEEGVMQAVRALHGEKTILIVAHRLSTVAHCDRLFRLEQGKIVEQGDTAQLLCGDDNILARKR